MSHSPSDSLSKETQLREELEKRAFHYGVGEFSTIDYCDFCHYSRNWIAQHGHGKDCLLYTEPSQS
jgi:hypothetical protein